MGGVELGGRWERPTTAEGLTSIGKDALLASSFIPVVGGVTRGATIGKLGVETGKQVAKRLTAAQAKNFGAQVGVELAADVGQLQAADRGAGGGSYVPNLARRWRQRAGGVDRGGDRNSDTGLPRPLQGQGSGSQPRDQHRLRIPGRGPRP